MLVAGTSHAAVTDVSGPDFLGTNAGVITLEAEVDSNPAQGVEFSVKVEDGPWTSVGTDIDPEGGYTYDWESNMLYSWEVYFRARSLPNGIWYDSESFRVFNLETGPITGFTSPASGTIDMNATYTPPSGYVFPSDFPQASGPTTYFSNTNMKYTGQNLTTPCQGSLTYFRTNFVASGTATISLKFAVFASSGSTPGSTLATSQAFTVGGGVQAFSTNISNVPVGSFVGIEVQGSNNGVFVFWQYSSYPGGSTPYGYLIYNTGTSWYTYSYYTGPAIEFTLNNPYVQFTGVEFGYKDGISGNPQSIGMGVAQGNSLYSTSWNTALPGQEFGSDQAYVGTRVYNAGIPSSWKWQGPYTITNSVGVTVTNTLNRGHVFVDNIQVDVPYSTTWTFLDIHTLSAPLYLNEEDTQRNVFRRWQHGGNRTQSFEFGYQSPRYYRAIYSTEFYYDVQTEYGTVSGTDTGWYLSNSMRSTSVDPFVVVGMGERYACIGYTATGALDDGDTNSTGNFRLSEPTTVVFNWAKQYYLEVNTPIGTPLGDTTGWYAEGSTVVSYVESPVPISDGRQWSCVGWTGTGSIGDGIYSYTGDFEITENTTITWNWQEQVRLRANTNYGVVLPDEETWHFLNDEVDLQAFSPGDSDQQRFFWQGWTGDGISSPVMTTEITVLMDGPKDIQGLWDAEYYLSAVAQNGSLADNYNGWYPAGDTVLIEAIPPAPEPGVRFVVGWAGDGFVEVEPAFDAVNPLSITMDGPVSVFATWERQYSLQIINPQGIGVPVPDIGTYW
ncbi:MAG: hypothetical protein U5N86_04835 [Planctomycetota bacterium]|nr:hypothetical protein [Planctomycetota bacterium]